MVGGGTFVAGLALGYFGYTLVDDDCTERDSAGDCILTEAEEANYNQDAAYEAGFDEGYDEGYRDGYELRVDPCQYWRRQVDEAEADLEFWGEFATPRPTEDGTPAAHFSELLIESTQEEIDVAQTKVKEA